MAVILFADDDPAVRQLVRDLFAASGHEVRLATSGEEAWARLEREGADLVLLDARMAPGSGLEICRRIKADPRFAHLPVLLLTGQTRLQDRLAGFDAGADDYLPKPIDPRELRAHVEALLRLTRQGLDRNPTTRLPGGRAAEREIARRFASSAPFALVYLDLDNFKPFADRFGFALADDAIALVGDLLRDLASEGAFVAHIGGDDFLLLTDPDRAHAQVTWLQQEFARRLRPRLPAEVAAAGRYRGRDREGVEREFPLTSISAAILRVDPPRPLAREELSARVAALKHAAKTHGGIAEATLDGNGTCPEAAGA